MVPHSRLIVIQSTYTIKCIKLSIFRKYLNKNTKRLAFFIFMDYYTEYTYLRHEIFINNRL